MQSKLMVVTIFLLYEALAQNPLKESWVTFTREDGSRSRDKLIVSEADQYITTKGDADTVIYFKRVPIEKGLEDEEGRDFRSQ